MSSELFSLKRRIWSQNRQRVAHWAVQRKERDAWMLLLALAMKGYRRPAQEHRWVTITSYRAILISDNANLVGGAKELVDAMERVGLLHRDSDEWVTITYRQEKCKRVDEHTEIRISTVPQDGTSSPAGE